MLPAPFAYSLPALPACFHSPAPLRQMAVMIYTLQSAFHCVSSSKNLFRYKQCHVLFESTWHFIGLYYIFSHPVYLCKTPGDLTLTQKLPKSTDFRSFLELLSRFELETSSLPTDTPPSKRLHMALGGHFCSRNAEAIVLSAPLPPPARFLLWVRLWVRTRKLDEHRREEAPAAPPSLAHR